MPVSEQNNFLYLTVALVLLLLVGALVEQFPTYLGQRLVQAFTVITIAAGVAGFKKSKFLFKTSIGFLVAVILVMFFSVLLDVGRLHFAHLILLIIYFTWATWLALKQVLFTGEIDGNKIVGAVCIYLLMGLVWTFCYLFIAELIPDAFIGLQQEPWYDNFADVAYYSYVTLTTLGYGDISPVAPVARFLVYMEAVVGVFYMAILVASLIGARMSDRDSD